MGHEVVSIFVSSPSDVKPERDIVSRVIGQLRRDFSARFDLREVLWERRALLATADPQSQIDRELPSTAIMVVILWTRLGSLLPPDRVRGPVSGRSVTGTEWEFENGRQAFAAEGRPQIVVYRKQGAAIARPDASPEEFTRLRTQLEAVDDFFGRWFTNDDGTARSSYRQFAAPQEFEELFTQHLRHLLEERLGAGGARIEWAGNPFLGLLSYEPDHARIFFGRTRARHALRAALEARLNDGLPFVLVVGGSGCGKSSLVKAGLIPDLRAGHWLPGIPDARFVIVRPSDGGGAPLDALAAALLATKHALPEVGADVATLAQLLRNDPAALRATIITALRAVTATTTPRVRGQVALTIVVAGREPACRSTATASRCCGAIGWRSTSGAVARPRPTPRRRCSSRRASGSTRPVSCCWTTRAASTRHCASSSNVRRSMNGVEADVDDGTAHVWSADGRLLATLVGPDDAPVLHAEFDQAGERVVAFTDQHIVIWSVAAPDRQSTVVNEFAEASFMAASPDAQWVAIFGWSRNEWCIHPYRVGIKGELGAALHCAKRSVEPVFAQFIDQSRRLLVVWADGIAQLLPLARGRKTHDGITRAPHVGDMAEFEIASGSSGIVAISADGSRIAAASDDGSTFSVWAPLPDASETPIIGPRVGEPWREEPPLEFAWTADGSRVFALFADPGDSVRVHSKGSWTTLTPVAERRWVPPISVTPDGGTLAICGQDGRVAVCSVATGCKLLAEFQARLGVRSVVLSPDGNRAMTAEFSRPDMPVRDVSLGADSTRPLATITRRGAFSGDDALDGRFSADGSWLFATWMDGRAQLVHVPDERTIDLTPDDRSASYVEFDPLGTRCLTVDSRAIIHVTDLAGGISTPLAGPKLSDERPAHFSPDGTRVAAVTDKGGIAVMATDGSDGGLSFKLTHGAARAAVFSPDGCRLAVARQLGGIELWSLDGPRLIVEIDLDGMIVHELAFTTDGARLLVAGAAGAVGSLRILDGLDWPAARAMLWRLIPQRLDDMERWALLGFEPLGPGDGR